MAPPVTVPGMDDAALIAGARAGDERVCEAFVRQYCGMMLAVATRILNHAEDARDAVQEAFLNAFHNIGGFDGRSSLATWLHRIVVNAALMKLRTRRRRPEISIEDWLPHFGEGEHQLDPPAPWKDLPLATLQKRELRQLVRQSIDQLSEAYRTVLLLRDIEGLDTEETARLLQTSCGVVKTRLHRARQALRTLLDPQLRRDDA